MKSAFLLFHLNLAYSSIPASARIDVIRRCYHPLLDLASETGISIGIELPSWTLRQIQALDPDWVNRFRELLRTGQCELIGSGYTQLIGPLVPYEVNIWNQRLGLEDYRVILATVPRVALVNEMAYSTGLVGVYKEAGYDGIVMDRDNVRLALGIEGEGYESVPSFALGTSGEALPVLWSDSILFQKVQRYAHGDITLDDYLSCFRNRARVSVRPLAVYCNDAEVFDYRPGRFLEESALNGGGEWKRVRQVLELIGSEGVKWLSPSEAIRESVTAASGPARTLSSITQPVPVKKQAKYNLSRWAVTGRNDLWINTICHRVHRALRGSVQPESWRRLCELWASDLRTHITKERWQETREAAAEVCGSLGLCADFSESHVPQDGAGVTVPAGGRRTFGNVRVTCDADLIYLTIESDSVKFVLNLRRGLTIHSLAFRSHDFVPVVGTIPHGYFDSIEYGADFYSGGVIVELPTEHRRVTDLDRVLPTFFNESDGLRVLGVVETSKGAIVKQYLVPHRRESVELGIGLPGWHRPHGIVRVGNITLLPEAFRSSLYLESVNGGNLAERFVLDRECDHQRPSSSLVSSTTGLGATTGAMTIGDEQRRLEIRWDPGECAAFPMVIHRKINPQPLTRVMFSLCELDDTSRSEGQLPEYRLKLSPMSSVL